MFACLFRNTKLVYVVNTNWKSQVLTRGGRLIYLPLAKMLKVAVDKNLELGDVLTVEVVEQFLLEVLEVRVEVLWAHVEVVGWCSGMV